MTAPTSLDPAIVAQLTKSSQAHKYDHGHALILSGGVGRGGAARLAARGALRIGAGLVTLGCPPAALLENAIALDAVMTRKVADPDALGVLLQDARINVLCIGPGFGTGPAQAALLQTALVASAGRRVVLDADALTLLAHDPALFDLLHEGCVLTPHGGEFARLFAGHATLPKPRATQAAARQAGCTVLFKGPETVIAAPDGTSVIHAGHAAPWLATAGSGDVLAGFIAGLLARGFDPIQAATTGAYLHTLAAMAFGPGLIAEDLPDRLPAVFRALGV